MWETALATPPSGCWSAPGRYEQRIMRLFGHPGVRDRRHPAGDRGRGLPLVRLEITTCLRRGEMEVDRVRAARPARSTPRRGREPRSARPHAGLRRRLDGRRPGRRLLAGATVAVAESCTGGLMAARLVDRRGSSDYVAGGVVAYSNAAKTEHAACRAELIAAHGAVSPEVAGALADGARARFGADVGIGITGVAGPGGGTEAKPVGTVRLAWRGAGDERWDRTVLLPGDRADDPRADHHGDDDGLRRLLQA